ncbi:MAG TPA: polysaccharide pyruvyl transferase family protein, partial [Thermoleophilaceae bacterium]
MASLAPAVRRRIRVGIDVLGQPKDRLVRWAATAGLRPLALPGQQRVLVLPPYAPGSLGDEALMEGTLGELRRRGWEPAIVEYRREQRWGPLKDCPSLDLSAFFHLDRQVAPLSRADLARFKAALAGYDRFVMIGADILDGYYNPSRTMRRLLLADIAARSGLATSVISCSFNAIPARRAAQAMQALPDSVRVAVRDEISHARTERVLGRPCELVADVAFLMTPDTSAVRVAEVADWAARQRAQGRLVIGTNLNLHPF